MVVALFLPSPSASESVADKEANLAEKKQLKSESSLLHTQNGCKNRSAGDGNQRHNAQTAVQKH